MPYSAVPGGFSGSSGPGNGPKPDVGRSMNLTAETFLEIVRSLRSDGLPQKLRRRKLPRVGARLRLVILPCGPRSAGIAPRAATVRLRDFSRNGMGFIHSEPLVNGQAFLICLEREAGGTVHLLGRVNRCRALDGRHYDIGGSIRLDVPRAEMQGHIDDLRRSA